jgi:hypothetical protein
MRYSNELHLKSIAVHGVAVPHVRRRRSYFDARATQDSAGVLYYNVILTRVWCAASQGPWLCSVGRPPQQEAHEEEPKTRLLTRRSRVNKTEG